MKNTVFLWGWKEYARAPDKTMSRERMAHLMRCWRRARIQGDKVNSLACISREPGRRTYRIENLAYGETATFEVIRHAQS